MKREIIITEGALKRIHSRLNQNFYRMIKGGNTSLGNNDALPGNPMEFQYKIMKERMSEVDDAFHSAFPDITTVEDAVNRIRKLIGVAKNIERPLRPQLSKICYNTIDRLFSVPEDTVEFACELVEDISKDINISVMPEIDSEYRFDDVEDSMLFDKEVMKRRMVDALIMGASFCLTESEKEYWTGEVNNLDDRLVNIYHEIDILDNYLLFHDEQEITDESPKQNSYVSVRLGHNDKKTEIKAEGTILPYLIRESVRGFMELFSSQGLPFDNKMAMMVVRASDFIMAEPWDMRLGVTLWRKLWDGNDSTRIVPYFFRDVCELDIDEFNGFMKNVLINTKKGERIKRDMISDINDDIEYQRFKDRMNQKNVSMSVIEDGVFTANELSDLTL